MTMMAICHDTSVSRSTGTPRALIVEDQPDIAELLVQIIRSLGFQTFRAGDGEEAVRLALAIGPSLMTLDLNLPAKDGNAVLRDLGSDPTTSQIPVIVISAYAAHLNRTKQVIGVLPKPFDVQELLDTIVVATG